MKRLIAMLLSAACLLICAAYAGPSVRAEESEDLCAVFAKVGTTSNDNWTLGHGEIAKNAFFAARWAYYLYSLDKPNGDDLVWGDWDGKTFTPGGRRNFVKIPAKPFDAYVPQCMALDGDFRTLLAAESEEYEKEHPCKDPAGEMEAYGTLRKLCHPQYVKELDAYLIDFFYATGGGGFDLETRGYTKNKNGTYSVYLQYVLYANGAWCDIPTTAEELKKEGVDLISIGRPYSSSAGKKNENYARYSVDEYLALLTDHPDWVEKTLRPMLDKDVLCLWADRAGTIGEGYYEITVTYSGGPIKILDAKRADALPAGLIAILLA